MRPWRMKMRNKQWSAVAAVATLALAACATTPPGAPAPGQPLPEPGSPCTGTWTSDTAGVVIVPFAGSVSGEAPDGTRHPVAGARLEVVAGPAQGDLSILTDAQGRFQGKLLLPAHGARECRDGVITAAYDIGSVRIAVRADGCSETHLTVDSRWEPRTITLTCEP